MKDAYPAFLAKQKIHLLLHLPEVMMQFGPPSAYNTERYILEVFKFQIRLHLTGVNLLTH